MATATRPAPQEDAFWPWLALSLQHVTQRFGENGETGVDFGIPMGTPITSLTAGTVLGTGFYGGGGVVSIKGNVNGQAASIYYQHLDDIAPGVVPGAYVNPGDLIGWSGGQLSGGHHPSSSRFSTGDHIEVGINAPFGGMWHPLGPNYDPLPWLRRLAAQDAPDSHDGSGAGTFTGKVHQAISGDANWLQIARAFDQAEQLRGLDPLHPGASLLLNLEALSIRTAIAMIGLVIILAVVINIVRVAIEGAAPAAGVAMQYAEPLAAAAAA